MEIEIRKLQQTDYDDIVGLMGELGYPTTLEEITKRFETLQADSNYQALVAIRENQILGFAGLCKALAYEFSGTYVRLLAFVVSSNVRKTGIGKLLLKACENWAIEQGAGFITLNSGNREERQSAHNFYKNSGYIGKSTGFSKKLL